MRKIITLGIMLLFLGMSISSTTGLYLEKQSIKPLSFGNTLYVGGSGPNNYTEIQDAIDDASDGDTVFVYDDSSPYYENLEVDKSITLKGENKDTTVIDGSGVGNVIKIIANQVTISGFTIQNSGSNSKEWVAGILVKKYSKIIKENIISNNSNGIMIIEGQSNVITGNTIVNNEGNGILLIDSYLNDIYENHVENNFRGLRMTPSGIPINHDYNTIGEWENNIYRNTITNNDWGIILEFEEGHNVFENSITDNTYGIIVYCCYDIDIYGNNITNNEKGIWLEGWKLKGIVSSHNNIFQNNIMYNLKGIDIEYAKNNLIYHNNFFCNIKYNAYDSYNNQWDNGSVGNFWDDYEGTDDDEDGIGDTPYTIPPSSRDNKDNYPLMEPYGNLPFIAKLVSPIDGYLYLMKRRTIPFFTTVILGKINIEVRVSKPSQVAKIEFYVDDNLKANFTNRPYQWLWSERVFFKHTIKIIAYDKGGNETSDEIMVWKFF